MAVRRLQVNICKEINNSGLPVSVSYLVLKDMLVDLEKAKNEATDAEIKACEKNMKEVTSDG